MDIYVVQPGDNIDRIAALYGVDTEELSYVNQIPYPYKLAIGEAILIPSKDTGALKEYYPMGGYAYPFISSWVLDQTLPYFNKLLIFSYGFTPEGELIYPEPSDDFMIVKAKEKNVQPILVLTPLGEDGRFSNQLIHTMLRQESVQENLIQNILSVVSQKGYAGVDVDFEYILAEDRDLFTAFVSSLTEKIHETGGKVSVALAPKTSAEQKGLLYEGKDYRGLGVAADEVLLMTYEWGYTYGPAMAVAPLNKVRQVVEYALTEIVPEKINLGIPNYGYDWTLPYIKGESKAVTIGNVEAVQIAIDNDAKILFDEVVKSPYFVYEKSGQQHEVWFEDVRSFNEKRRLVQEYGLAGFGIWQIMRLFRAGWIVLSDFF